MTLYELQLPLSLVASAISAQYFPILSKRLIPASTVVHNQNQLLMLVETIVIYL